MNDIINPDRRSFIIRSSAITGAIAVEFSGWGAALAAHHEGVEVTHWIVINPDDSITIRIARSELGQGSFTGLAMLVAEELQCDWNKVKPEYADVNEHVRRNRIWGNMSTGGSRAIRDSQEYLRKAGASAREMLVSAAAKEWGVPVSEVTVANSVITHKASNRKTTFGKVAGAASKLEVPKEPKLKDPKDWTLIGTSPPRFDIPEKTTGEQVFAADVRLSGMLHASIRQVPVFGGKLKSYDEPKILGRRGVKKVVAGPDWVAVVADNWWRANEALKALPIEWTDGGNGNVSSESIMKFLRTGIDAPSAPVGRKDGDAVQALAGAAKTFEAEYYAPFLNHATMEPQTATALITTEGVEVWVGTQNGESTITAASEAAGVPLENVIVHKMHAGGGFGRRTLFNEYTVQAIRIAQTMPGTPVRLQWSREEDMWQGRYRPVSLVKLKAGLDKDNKWVAWQVRQAEQSVATVILPNLVKDGVDTIGTRVFSDNPYDVPNFLNEYAMRNTHVTVGPWRAVAHTMNPFFRECFIDEICAGIKADPYQFRRPLLSKKPKDLGVLDAVAKAAKWGEKMPQGIHRGIALSDAYGSYTAAVVDLSVEDSEVSVKRVYVAIDSGYIVHRDAVIAQIESGVVWALSSAMLEETTIKDGRAEQSNFSDYPVLRLAHMPEVVPVIVPSGGFWGGVGEPPLAAVIPALGNAIFAATGKRLRSMPLKHHGLSYA
ncbi:MAG: molybdopterin cofactor-binding domain-containing protein [Burkholderiales bacterium]